MADFKEELKNKASESAEIFSPANIDRLANSLGRSLKSFLDEKGEKLIDMKDNYEGTIKEHPLSSVATAFTAGIIIGLLLRKH